MRASIFSQLLIAAILVATSAHAAPPACRALLNPKPSNLPRVVKLTTLEALGLDHPEIEAKMQIPDKATIVRIKDLVGTEITLPDADGRPVVFQIEMNKEHIYEDTYFDVVNKKSLALFDQGGLLRQRVRYDKLPGEKDYKLKKVVFQSKNGAVQFQDLNKALFARNEVRGEESKNLKKFNAHLDEKLQNEDDDNALTYARQLVGPRGDFVPVLFSRDKRFFMKISPKLISGSPVDPTVPSFYISVDRVENEGLVMQKAKGSNRELEPEIIDDLTLDSPAVMRRKVIMLSHLSDYLVNNFGLIASEKSKYQTGIESSVLKKK